MTACEWPGCPGPYDDHRQTRVRVSNRGSWVVETLHHFRFTADGPQYGTNPTSDRRYFGTDREKAEAFARRRRTAWRTY